MIDRATFSEHVRDAFAHLHDLAHLRRHPLARLLARRDQALSGDALRRALLQAIEQLKPPPDAPRDSASGRRYRYLALRYLKGASRETICRELLISPRQASRDHLDALEAVSAVLLDMCRASPAAAAEAAITEGDAPLGRHGGLPLLVGASAGEATLDAELARAGFGATGEQRADLSEVIVGAAEIAGTLAEHLGGDLHVLLPPALPPAVVSRTILRQILLSLLSYAIEVAPATPLTLTAADCGASVRLRIAIGEQGGGRREERSLPLPSASPHARRPTSRRKPGTSWPRHHHLAELHGVAIEHGPPGAGRLPIEVVVPVARPVTVLVVDDNPDVARLFARYLRGTTYRLLHAKTWQQALELLEGSPPGIIILDVMLPSLDGWDILRQLRGRPDTRDIPVVVCSVLPEKSLALAMGVAGFLPKPVTPQSLLTALQRCQPDHQAERRGYSSDSPWSPPPTGRQDD